MPKICLMQVQAFKIDSLQVQKVHTDLFENIKTPSIYTTFSSESVALTCYHCLLIRS